MPQKSQRGFSLVEVLVVMGIIAVLVTGVVVAIASVLEQRRRLETVHAVDQATLLVEDWYRQFERYPPSSMTRLGRVLDDPHCTVQLPNETNDGIETVYQALLWPGADVGPTWSERQLGNTDADRLEPPLHGRRASELFEIVDAYGNPLVYFAHGDYARYAEEGAVYRLLGGRPGRDVAPRPYRRDDGTFARPRSFQVFSMGPDGVPNTEDDVGNWSR